MDSYSGWGFYANGGMGYNSYPPSMDANAHNPYPSGAYPSQSLGGSSQSHPSQSLGASSQSQSLTQRSQGTRNSSENGDASDVMEITPAEHKKGKKKKTEGKGTPNKRWDKDMDDFLIQFLVEQAKLGLKVDKTFKRTALVAAADAVSKEFGVEIYVENVENHLSWVKKKFGDLRKAFRLSGAGWNDKEKMLTLTPKVYSDYIKSNSHMKSWINTPIKHFEELAIICGDDFATGDGAKSVYEDFGAAATETVNIGDDSEQVVQISGDSPPPPSVQQPTIPPAAIHATVTSLTNKKSRNSGRNSGNKRSRTEEDDRYVLVEKFSGGMYYLGDSITRGTEHWTERLGKAIFGMEGYSLDDLKGALMQLSNNESEARLFIIQPKELQEKWLNEFLAHKGHSEEP